eukprot:6840429-Pyramimonas_sp.AAC.1
MCIRDSQDTGEYNREALNRFLDQAVDDAVTTIVSSTMDQWHRSDRPVGRREMARMLLASAQGEGDS